MEKVVKLHAHNCTHILFSSLKWNTHRLRLLTIIVSINEINLIIYVQFQFACRSSFTLLMHTQKQSQCIDYAQFAHSHTKWVNWFNCFAIYKIQSDIFPSVETIAQMWLFMCTLTIWLAVLWMWIWMHLFLIVLAMKYLYFFMPFSKRNSTLSTAVCHSIFHIICAAIINNCNAVKVVYSKRLSAY